MSSSGIGYADFLRGLLNNPKAVSAPTPSGPALCRAIAEEVDLDRPGYVLELGPGTGVITQAILARGLAPERLIAVEYEASFVRSMRRRFSDITVHHGNALDFESYLPRGSDIATIVSGIPLLNLPSVERQSLISRGLAQGNNRRFVQLSYGWFPPVSGDSQFAVTRKVVLRNFPPACVWIYRQRYSD